MSETITTVSAEPRSAEPADLALAQTVTVAPSAFGDDAVDDHVAIENHGPGPTDAAFHYTCRRATIESATIDQVSGSITATEVARTVPHLDSGGTVEANIVIVELPGDATTGSVDAAERDRIAIPSNPGQRQQRRHCRHAGADRTDGRPLDRGPRELADRAARAARSPTSSPSSTTALAPRPRWTSPTVCRLPRS